MHTPICFLLVTKTFWNLQSRILESSLLQISWLCEHLTSLPAKSSSTLVNFFCPKLNLSPPLFNILTKCHLVWFPNGFDSLNPGWQNLISISSTTSWFTKVSRNFHLLFLVSGTRCIFQSFQRLIQMLVFKIICPCGVQFHYFILFRSQNNMMVSMPFPGRVENIGFQNLYSPLRILLISHKQINVRRLPKLRDWIKPRNGTAFQCYCNDALFRQKGGESCIQYL